MKLKTFPWYHKTTRRNYCGNPFGETNFKQENLDALLHVAEKPQIKGPEMQDLIKTNKT